MAEPVDLSRAQKATDAFLKGRVVAPGKGPGASIRAQATSVAAGGFREVRGDDGTLLAYVADLEPRGFVAMSADTDMAPVIAYSFRTSFPDGQDRANPLGRMLREDMRLRIKALAEHPELKSAETARAWELYISGETDEPNESPFQQWPPEGTTSTGGWLATAWDQGEPYNAFCPLDPTDGVRSYVGCVATAFAQLVHYHRVCDISFSADDSYRGYNGMQVDTDAALYDYPSFAELNGYLETIRLKYSEGTDLDDMDIAALSFACGLAVEMDYGSDGSGASTYDVQTALLDRFGYYSADMLGGLFGDALSILQENVINGLPALLSFSPPDNWGGHVIVCDGYNTDGEYHLNYGWGTEHPEEITEVWYRLPTGYLYRDCVITESIANIQPAQPAIEVDSSTLSFYAVPGGPSDAQILRIKNNVANAQVNSITSPDGFLIGRLGEAYGRRVDSFVIQKLGQGASIGVQFSPPQAGGYYGVLEIQYSNGSTRRVVLRGWAYEGGVTVPAGEVSGTWTQYNSPFFVTGNIRVPQDDRLKIEPGVKILFTGPYSLTVGKGATLIAEGTAAEPVEFTALNKEAGWGGLRLIDSGSDDLLRYCSIRWVKKGTGLMPRDSSTGVPTADLRGGALYCAASDPIIENCWITNNTGDMGGAIYCIESWPIISNTLIANNASTGGSFYCGGICCDSSGMPEIVNCTIVNNFPGGLFSSSWEGMNVTNTLLWGNERYQIQTNESVPLVTFCDVQNGYRGQGNIDADPCFLDPTEGVGAEHDASNANWALKSSSPCINAGMEINDLPATDLAGGDRLYSDVIDVGAYENRSDLPLMTAIPSTTIDAGFVAINASSTAVFEVVNTGKLEFEIEEILIDDPNGIFSIGMPVQNRLLSPGDSVEVQVAFRPAEERIYAGELFIQSTSSNAPSMRISLHGVGVAGTIVPGGSVSGTWKKASSPYTVTGDIRVPKTRTLTIEPGVVVKFAGHFSLTVGYRATLQAAGTPEDGIVFTATDPSAGWFGIRFVNSASEDVLKHCTLEYARKPRTGGGAFENLYGGAVLCYGSWYDEPGMPIVTSPTIDSCLLARNYASTGGAIMCYDGSRAIITNNVIVDNDADMDGGAIAMYYCDCTISNNVIARNNALIGGGIMNWMGVPAIRNNTIVANRPSAMHLEPTTEFTWMLDTAPVVNNIIWQNEIWLSDEVASGEYGIRFNDIQGGWGVPQTPNDAFGGPDGQGNIAVDPLFADAANGDYHLKSQAGRWDPTTGAWLVDDVTSPCIDAGDPTTDAAKEPQPSGQRVNLGAYGGTDQASKSPSGTGG